MAGSVEGTTAGFNTLMAAKWTMKSQVTRKRAFAAS